MYGHLSLFRAASTAPAVRAPIIATVRASWVSTARLPFIRKRLAVRAPPICRQELLLVGAAHELRTPLTVVRGHLELLQRQSRSPTLGVVLDELDRLDRIVARMLLIVELERESPAFEQVDLSFLLSEAARVRPVVHVSPSAKTTISADARLLLLALDELLANSLARSRPDDSVLLATRAIHGGVEISVTDRGRGIDGETADRLFDCFARVEPDRSRSSGGAGLGLAIVRAVAHAHRGHCGVRTPDVQPGAAWWLWLPTVRDDA
jgi:two-component system, OmpR family, sensor kinase